MINLKSLIFESITDTPEFKRWFGKSRVVDKQGNPLVVYHGTSIDINFKEFFPFSHFGTLEQSHRTLREPHMGLHFDRIIPCYLRIENPFVVPDNFRKGDTWITDLFRNIISFLRQTNPTNAKDFNDKFGALFRNAERNPQKYRKKLGELILRWCKIKGYDGFIYENQREGKGLSFMVFDPTQVKSAIGNTGEFNLADPDITKENV